MAGTEGDAVTWLSADLDAWETSTAFASQPVRAVQDFVTAHPIEADRGRVWSLRLPASNYLGPDDGAGEVPPGGWTITFPHNTANTAATGTHDRHPRSALLSSRSKTPPAFSPMSSCT